MSARTGGILLFLPVPLVLWLFTQAPLGVLPSLALGVAVMVTHRLYARPFVLARAGTRCLWCGGDAPSEAPALGLVEPLGKTSWRACGPAHAGRLARVLGWASTHPRFLKVGILGSLALFLAASTLAGAGYAGPLQSADAVAVFRAGIALTVLSLALLAPLSAPAKLEELRVPFPTHIQALIGTWAVLWLFRLVGVVWLALSLLHVARRTGLAT